MLKNAVTGIAVVVIGLFTLSLPAQAQDAGKNKMKPGRGMMGRGNERLMKELNLTEEQKTKIKAIREEGQTKLQPIKDDAKLTMEQKKEKAQPIMKDTMKKIMDVLTPEQKAKMKELREKQKTARGAKENSGKAAKP
jgi:Spy/CpxP family protein refolding chaperone